MCDTVDEIPGLQRTYNVLESVRADSFTLAPTSPFAGAGVQDSQPLRALETLPDRDAPQD